MKHTFENSNSLRYLIRYGRNERDSMITAPRFLNDNSTDIRRQLQSRDQEDTILANLLDFTAHFSTWGAQHDLVMGAEYDREIRRTSCAPVPIRCLRIFTIRTRTSRTTARGAHWREE